MKRHSLIFRLGGGDRSRMAWVESSSVRTEVQLVGSNGALSHGIGETFDQLNRLGITPSPIASDLLIIASAVYAADKRINRGSEAQDGWTREIDLHIPVGSPETWASVSSHLQTMLQFLTGDHWRFFFRLSPAKYRSLIREAKSEAESAGNSVCLFSGGLDSFIGAADLFEEGDSPLLVSHGWVSSDSNHQKLCLQALVETYGETRVQQLRSRVGFGEQLVRNSSSERSERSRSFLFFTLAALAASGKAPGTTIYIPENAFISLNIPLDPLRLGSFSTRTTHPFYVARFNELLSSVGITAKLFNPYRHVTKGEMIGNSKNRAFIETNHTLTLSCSSASKARWKGFAPSHCGHCVPCIIRRAALARMSIPDSTVYVLSDLHSRPLDSTKSEGENIRSFQFAIHRLNGDMNRARVFVHQSGPLSDHLHEIDEYADVYLRGLREVETFLKGVIARPNA